MNIGMFEGFSKPILIVSALAIIAAVFGLTAISAQTTHTLTVSKTGAGADRGIIISNPAGINCGSTCSAEFNAGDTVTLTPSSAAGTLAVFSEWGGACSGTGACIVTMDAAKNVTAHFSEAAVFQKCTLENPSLWGVRYRLTGDNVTVSACRSRCIAAGGNGNFAINKPLGWCVCGTDRQPQSIAPAQPVESCDQTCPFPYSCGGNTGQFSVYGKLSTTAAPVSISGRVMTAQGRGIRNVMIVLIDSQGNERSAQTTSFGYYRFDDVVAGETVTITAKARKFKFVQSSIVRTTNESITDADFISEQ